MNFLYKLVNLLFQVSSRFVSIFHRGNAIDKQFKNFACLLWARNSRWKFKNMLLFIE
jgi:hypothetical protein